MSLRVLRLLCRLALPIAPVLAAGCVQDVALANACDEEADDADLLYPLTREGWWRYAVLEAPGDALGRFKCPDKIVVNDAQPMRSVFHDESAHRVKSLRAEGWAFRWQTVEPDGSVMRLFDEWRSHDAELLRIEFFCPPKFRVASGDHACGGTRWQEQFQTLRIDYESVDPPVLEYGGLEVDVATCEPLTELPEEAVVTRHATTKHWMVESVGMPYAFDVEHRAGSLPDGHDPRVLDEFAPLVVSNVSVETDLETGAELRETSRFTWVRGLGKVHEDLGPDEEEWLVDFCFADEPDCDRDAAWAERTFEEALASCEGE